MLSERIRRRWSIAVKPPVARKGQRLDLHKWIWHEPLTGVDVRLQDANRAEVQRIVAWLQIERYAITFARSLASKFPQTSNWVSGRRRHRGGHARAACLEIRRVGVAA